MSMEVKRIQMLKSDSGYSRRYLKKSDSGINI